MALEFHDHRADLVSWAFGLGVSREATQIYAAADTIDLHIESFVWTRAFGYDLARRHGRGLLAGGYYSQVDFPRLLEAGMTGSVWSICTNPLRLRGQRTRISLENLRHLRALIEAHPDELRVVTDHAGYVDARRQGKHACWLAIQGGNALDSQPGDLERIPDNLVSRITVVHLTSSTLGATSSPLARADSGLTELGRDYIRAMNAGRILVDLAHISRRGFWQALEVHDRSQPAIVSHTGVCAVHDLWRNIDDEQIKAIAATGGVIGIVYHSSFLGGPTWTGSARAIVDHMAHVVRVAGDDFVALGSDWDGLIVTPKDMRTVLELPVLVQYMLDRGWSSERIGKILGGNYLRVMKAIRPGSLGAAG
ncbi:MAG: membrane dipeptidase [Candidatus Schekmanbacteria bacterium]|nr:membrane dipeptidase [Candidatus Schekmanbacteria bacterium]